MLLIFDQLMDILDEIHPCTFDVKKKKTKFGAEIAINKRLG